MSYQLETSNGKILTIYNQLDNQKAYHDARNYLLAQEHRRNELEDKFEEKLEKFGFNDSEVKELYRKKESLNTEVYLKDSYNRAIYKYEIDYGIVSKYVY